SRCRFAARLNSGVRPQMAILAPNVKFHLVFLCLLAIWLLIGSPGTGSESFNVSFIGGVFYIVSYATGWSFDFRPRTVAMILAVSVLSAFLLPSLDRSGTLTQKFVWFSYFVIGYSF